MNAPKPPLGEVPEKFNFDPKNFLTPEQHLEHARRLLVATERTIADAVRGGDSQYTTPLTVTQRELLRQKVEINGIRIRAHLDVARAIKESERESW